MIAVAGPVHDNHISFTNNSWDFSGDDIAKTFSMKAVRLLNDYTAKALSLPDLTADDYVELLSDDPQPLKPVDNHVTSVLGPGTGLGVSAIVETPEGMRIPLATEGGHIGYAPETDEEVAVKLWLRQRFQRVSVERVLCGSGLVNVYHAISDIRQRPFHPDWSAAEISGAALDDSDDVAVASLTLFCEVLGSVAGDVALVHGVSDGVYIAGGIPPKILPFLQASAFRKRFENKGRFEGSMKRFFTRVITQSSPAKIGCAHYLWNRLQVD